MKVLFLWSTLALLSPALVAQEAPSEAELAVKKIKPAAGLRAELFAAEPQLVNPVSFSIDERGRFYVVETNRMGTSVLDMNGRKAWWEDDLASGTVEDRLALLRRRLGPQADRFSVESERIRLIEDRNGTGRADSAVTFAEGFNGMGDGVAAGILARGKDVWFTCIPSLWHLQDTTGAGVADRRKVLHTGFGVHVGYIGHDLHGLRFGPDGKLYFTMADRGCRVNDRVNVPDMGCVLRCNPDGSDLEVYATGLRNPQELAFDSQGNLWTGDNNADFGEKARWVYVVEGGDSGWRVGYQYLPK